METCLHMAYVVDTRLVQVPDRVMWQPHDGELHTFCHLPFRLAMSLIRRANNAHVCECSSYLAEAFGLRMLLKTKGREVDTRSEDSRLGQNTDAPHSIDLHFHIRVAVGVT